jgi:hypothetical protein
LDEDEMNLFFKIQFAFIVLFSCLLEKEDLPRLFKRTVEFTDELDMDEYSSFKGANIRLARSVEEK